MLQSMSITIATHNGDFHPDDVFAVATLQLHLGEAVEIDIVRTRDPETLANATWVVDVGGVYDPSSKRFDHHQAGAPVRENGIPHAAFGLLWDELGASVCGSTIIADELEHKLVQPIDAGDNGINLYELNEYHVAPFELYQVIESFHQPGDGHTTTDEMFLHAVDFARELLQRLIAIEADRENARADAHVLYAEQKPTDGIIIAEHPIRTSAFQQFLDIHTVVKPRSTEADTAWVAKVVNREGEAFANRALFPETWAGLRDHELAQASGIADAIFCHTGRFIFVAKSKEGAIAAARAAVPTDLPSLQ